MSATLTNTELIKKYLLPILPLENKANKDILYQKVTADIWKVGFVQTINNLVGKKLQILKEDLHGLDFTQAMTKYKSLIDGWTPDKTLRVFWIEGFKIFTTDQYEILKQFYNQYPEEIFNTLMSGTIHEKKYYQEILYKLSVNKDLSASQFEALGKNIEVFIGESNIRLPNFETFKKLFEISQLYGNDSVWKSYLEVFNTKQEFIHKVKDFFKINKIDFEFEEKEIDFFKTNKSARVLNVDEEIFYKYNKKIKVNFIENIMTGLNNYFHEFAKNIEIESTMGVEKKSGGNQTISIFFNEEKSLKVFDERLEKFLKNIIKIIGKIEVELNSPPSYYRNQFENLELYYKLDDNFDDRPKGKTNKI